jgi:hypothetical protein
MSNLGTRHRAGIGVTEDSDALAVVVSEETGQISVAHHGRLIRNLDQDRLRRVLRTLARIDRVDRVEQLTGWRKTVSERFPFLTAKLTRAGRNDGRSAAKAQ